MAAQFLQIYTLFVILLTFNDGKYNINHMNKLGKSYKYPFLDPSLPWDKRVDDLVGRLTVDEVIGQTSIEHGSSHSYTPAISRLGIAENVWITECGRGQGKTDGTAFPQAIGLAATFRYF